MAGQQSVTAQGWYACEVGAGEDPPQFLCIGLAFPVVTAFPRTARVERNPRPIRYLSCPGGRLGQEVLTEQTRIESLAWLSESRFRILRQ